ncbi:MAG TPA: hypothetical protein VID03_03675 [Acidimicrobiia bacterium]|jgi:hypothetical protein
MATMIFAWVAVGDVVLSVAVVSAAAFFNPWVVGLVAVAAFASLERACCMWIDLHWAEWSAREHDRLERRIEQWRHGGVMSRVVGWISGASASRYTIAAVLTSPTMVVAIGRMMTGEPVGRHKVDRACVAYGLILGGLMTFIGWALTMLPGVGR